jgi:hypothetical protein
MLALATASLSFNVAVRPSLAVSRVAQPKMGLVAVHRRLGSCIFKTLLRLLWKELLTCTMILCFSSLLFFSSFLSLWLELYTISRELRKALTQNLDLLFMEP